MEKKYEFETNEKKMQELWQAEKIYHFQNGRERKVFSIDTPPPTVSGRLHIGHVFSYTQAEMIARYKRMQGFDVFYPFGFDDNGLPTERLVERESKIHAKDMARSEFRLLCDHTAQKYEDEFQQIWQSLGFSVDWNQEYRTVSKSTQRISQRSFLELVKLKKAYIKESPVLWCTECQTSIAQAELDTKEIIGTFNYLQFQTDEGPLLIATTRPELLYGCVCIFIHPNDERYQSFIGKQATVPLYHFTIPILSNPEVDMTIGTGIVMCATFGDTTDASWYDTYKLPYKKIILPNGRINDNVPYLSGLTVKEARAKIIMLLREDASLIRQEAITHTVAVHERCQCEIELIPSKQWYIDILSGKDRFLKAADEINWYPAHMKTRYQRWVENLKWDWCISRQRYFGVPIPVWYCKECHQPIFAEDSQLPVNPIESKPLHPCSCGCNEFIPETAVFDTWATSSITPLINARFGEPDDRRDQIFPMGIRAQAHDIIRTWAFYTIVKSLYHTGQLPWKDIMISGFVLAKPGEKISKSKNNGSYDPLCLIQTHSADAMRYWAANAKLGTDTFFSEEELKPAKRFINKLWNASKFAILQLNGYQPTFIPTKLLPVDSWILERIKQTTNSARKLLDQYEIGQARHEIDDLFWKDFCDYYIEIVKERLYQAGKHGIQAQLSGQYAIYHALLGILKLYAIYTPHITDYIYQEYYRQFEKDISIHTTIWSDDTNVNPELIEFGEVLKITISEIRKQKSAANLSMKDPIDCMLISTPDNLKPWLKDTESDLYACTNAQSIHYIPSHSND